MQKRSCGACTFSHENREASFGGYDKILSMEKEKESRQTWKLYWRSRPDLFRYQIVATLLLGCILFVLRFLSNLMLQSTGRVAVSSGDYMFLFTSWQGIALILFGLAVLFVYVAFDINTKIIYADKLLEGEPGRMFSNIREGLLSIRSFFCLRGLGIVLYIALLAPVVGVGASIALTENLYIPTFITSVIETTPLYNALYTLALLVFAFIGILNIFCIHGVVIDKLSVSEAIRRSRELMRKNWKDYLKNTLLFSVLFFLVNVLLVVMCVILAVVVFILARPTGTEGRFWLLLVAFLSTSVIFYFNEFTTPFYLLRTTQLYYRYTGKQTGEIPAKRPYTRFVAFAVIILAVAALIGLAKASSENFDALFPAATDVRLIAHRGGGSEGPENTVTGIDVVAGTGVYGSEIDIQRTADGYYVVNHDATFARLTGVNKKPGEMTLEEIRKLVIQDPKHPDSPEIVATFEEMLDAANGRLILFVKLKGESADRKMVDDAVKMIEERGMRDQCVLISLQYDLIDYAETEYPQMQTGFLTFLTFGDTARLNCDFIGLEEESATDSTIEQIHKQGKRALVWTPNEENKQKHFLLSEADGIITDNVFQAQELQEKLSKRDDIERMIDKIFG